MRCVLVALALALGLAAVDGPRPAAALDCPDGAAVAECVAAGPSTSVVPEGDVPGRSRVCPPGQVPQTLELFPECGPQLPKTGARELIVALIQVGLVLFVGGLILSGVRYLAARRRD